MQAAVLKKEKHRRVRALSLSLICPGGIRLSLKSPHASLYAPT